MSSRDNNDGKKQKKDKGIIISSSFDQKNSRIKGLDKNAKESNEGKKEKKAKGNTSGNNSEPSEEQQTRAMNQNRGFDQHDEQKRQLNTNKKDKKNRR
ncbi:hypothetical protein MKX03_000879 [Papaver bracteatum]|nr:hypothetical protein MKX03_000879 [Papaver bracteatum]